MRESWILFCVTLLCILLSNPFGAEAEREYRYHTDNKSAPSDSVAARSASTNLQYNWNEAGSWLDDVDVINFTDELSRSDFRPGDEKFKMIEQKFDVTKNYEWELENQDSWFTTDFKDFN